MDTIVITIPWAVILVILLLAVAAAAFLLAFFLWIRGRRLQPEAEISRPVDRKPVPGQNCPRCGMKVQPWFRFCVHCGEPLGKE